MFFTIIENRFIYCRGKPRSLLVKTVMRCFDWSRSLRQSDRRVPDQTPRGCVAQAPPKGLLRREMKLPFGIGELLSVEDIQA